MHIYIYDSSCQAMGTLVVLSRPGDSYIMSSYCVHMYVCIYIYIYTHIYIM